MSDGRKYYCYCDANCKYETMTKEQILAAITQAVRTGTVADVDTGFVTKVKETNKGGHVTFWVGTNAQYNAIEAYEKDCVYIITDETTDKDIAAAIKSAEETAKQLEVQLAGKAPAGYGLGAAKWIDDGRSADAMMDNGWFAWGSGGVADAPFSAGYMFVVARQNGKHVTQFAFNANYSGVGALQIVTRTYGTSGWSEWESDNPPMVQDVEYVTTERYDGKPVYAKRLCYLLYNSFSGTYDAGLIKDTGIPYAGTKIVGLSAFLRHNKGAVDTNLPYIHTDGTIAAAANISCERAKTDAVKYPNYDIVIGVGSALSGVSFEFDCVIKYVKE